MSAIGMRVSYKSGPVVGQAGIIIDERLTMRGTPQYLVKFADGRETWLLASNVKF